MSDMEPADQIPAYSSRRAEFGSGVQAAQGELTPPSLTEIAQRYNAQVPKSIRGTGSLNGVSADQYEATVGGLYKNPNGISQANYAVAKFYAGNA